MMGKQHKKFLVLYVSETRGEGDYAPCDSNPHNASNSYKKAASDLIFNHYIHLVPV